jgi:translation initiation factor 2 beta subunit (eIF-2beta)/eIF-5
MNIPKYISDPFYRYKREKVKLSEDKLGTKINNLSNISKSINLKSKTIISFIQKKLGCNSKNDILYKKNLNENSIDDLLEDLIQCIICTRCNNPEIEFIKNKKVIKKKCKACGYEIEVDDDLKKFLLNEC